MLELPQSTLPLWPEAASDLAGRVDRVYLALLAMSAGIVLLLLALIAYALFSHGPRDRGLRGWLRRGRWQFELGWTLAPLCVFLGLFVWGARLYLVSYDPGEGGREIHIVGRQWMWQAYHAEGRMEHDGLHLPLGEPVTLILSSEDVIHSFYVPAFRLKRDVLPGKYVRLHITPTEAGRFRLFCAEYCGTAHSDMAGWVTVLPPDDFAAWLAEPAAPGSAESLAERGRALYTSLGCAGCHEPGGTVHAPRLAGLAGRSVALTDGSFVTANTAYLRDSILLPSRQIVAGYADLMPSYQGQLSEAELAALIAYLQTRPAGEVQP